MQSCMPSSSGAHAFTAEAPRASCDPVEARSSGSCELLRGLRIETRWRGPPQPYDGLPLITRLADLVAKPSPHRGADRTPAASTESSAFCAESTRHRTRLPALQAVLARP